MGIREDIKILVTKEAKTMTEIAAKIYKEKDKRQAVNSLSQKLRLKTIRFEEVRQIADILGYDIEFVKRK
ncbi:LLM class flavin-dependent oxidoreductase [bacterium]|nr:LLM class flavin-dependent oxidoreductase [bacterium]